MKSGNKLCIETCAKQDGRLIPLDALTSLSLKDPNYVSGCIRVAVDGQLLLGNREQTDIVHWWAGMSNVLRAFSDGTAQRVERYFPDWPAKMIFEIDGDRMVWTVQVPEVRIKILDRLSALRTLEAEYQHVFERMRILNPACKSDYDMSLAYMSYFKAR